MRAWIYDKAIVKLTQEWYREVMLRLPDNARVLDVGVGTCAALCANADLVRKKNLSFVGIDIDSDYLVKAHEYVEAAGLSDRVDLIHQSVYLYEEKGFDAVYYSASFMLLPEPVKALLHSATLLNPEGLVYFTQTFHEKKTPFMEKAKPLLKKITTIDFGTVTYEETFRNAIEEARMEILELTTIGTDRNRTYRIARVKP